MPDFEFENKLWKKGFRVVAGADEVGRGAWAGPTVAATVVFASHFKLIVSNSKLRVDDSKKLSSVQREQAERWIKKNCFAWGIGVTPVWVINKLGIGKATQVAFRRAIVECNIRLLSTDYSLRQEKKTVGRPLAVDYLLIDAFYLPYTRGLRRKNARKNHLDEDSRARQTAIIGGDTKSFSIAAASILAKVYRDSLMTQYAKKHEVYGWEKNKGYGTRQHQEAIKRYGLTCLHRKQFVRRFIPISNF